MGLSVKQIERAQYLRSSMVTDALLGNYKKFKEAKKEYATLAVQDFKKVRELPCPRASAPIFTRYGLNLLYVMVRDFFRIKSPAEKKLKQMGIEELKRQRAQTGELLNRSV